MTQILIDKNCAEHAGKKPQLTTEDTNMHPDEQDVSDVQVAFAVNLIHERGRGRQVENYTSHPQTHRGGCHSCSVH